MNGRSVRPWMRALALAALLPLLAVLAPDAAAAQARAFPTPEAAMEAFGDALATSDDEAMRRLLGGDWHAYIPALGAEQRYRFLSAWARSHAIERVGGDRARVTVGGDGWTLPIPIARDAGGWRFDLRAGADEIRIRRIGRNENAVMQVMLAIVDAQKEYARRDPDRDGILEYARRFASTKGRKDGLWWPTAPGEPQSPLGPALDPARVAQGPDGSGYHGYRYRLLTSQGPGAPGGAYDYVARGRMIGGFAVVAWPVRYGDTGVMTFMVSHDGVLFEKDLGHETAARAAAIARFDPGTGWRRVEPH